MLRAIAVLVAAAVASLSLAAAVANARTPTAAPTPTPTVAAPTTADYDIILWADARQSSQPIVAKIGDVVCGGETQAPVMPPDSGVLVHHVRMQSAASSPGCGRPGATVTFFVGDRQADRTAEWRAGEDQSLTLLVGPPFARIWGNADLHLNTGGERLAPFIGQEVCGYQENSWQGAAPPFGYSLVVYSRELRAGCGVEGAQVSFKLLDEHHNVLAVAVEKGFWHAWDGTPATFESLNLTMVPPGDIRVGSVGTGDSRESDGPLIDVVVLGLALAGLATLATGATLRKRTT
ncbi:MAG: hypothetical protein MUP15_05410 [Dehalococcoidia bacterium]|nr:hypothetical protein [Dehalococcoidia bacterium]